MTEAGVQFPTDDEGRRSSLRVNQAIWADAAEAVGADAALVGHTLAERIRADPAWRKHYLGYVHELTVAGGSAASVAQAIAARGLASARSRLVYVRDGEELPLESAAALTPSYALETRTVVGEAEPAGELLVPYLGQQLRGDALRRRLAVWVAHGVIEPSAASAVERVLANPDWLRLEGRRIVVVGAGAQTSPLPVLASWGADVVAVDLPGERVWRRILDTAHSGAGRVHVPMPAGESASADIATRAGVDVIDGVPELLGWLGGLAELPLVLGFYVYADGPLHVQATVAADLVGSALRDSGAVVAPAFAGTPSDCYLVPMDAVEDSNRRRRVRPRRAFELAVRGVTAGRFYNPAYTELVEGEDGESMGVADALVSQQGPNYALAKRLQRWRAIDSWRVGEQASFNVAPPAWTTSVTKNRLLAAGYHGAHFAGLEVFSPETMQTLMTALLVHDLHVPGPPEDSGDPGHVGHVEHPGHPELAVARAGVHGGYWRVPHDINSTLIYSAVRGAPRAFGPRLRAR